MMSIESRRQIAHQARRHRAFCAQGVHLFQQQFELSDEQLAAWLGCDLDQVYALCLCRVPNTPGAQDAVLLYIDVDKPRNLWILLCFLIALTTTDRVQV